MKFFSLSMDDGVEQDKKFIEIMKKFGLSGTFNLNAGCLGDSHKITKIHRIPKDEIKQVYEGFEVASHGYKHEMYRYMSKKKTEQSLARDIKELSDLVGYQIVGHAFPYDMSTTAANDYLRGSNMLYTRKALGKKPLFYYPANPLNYIATCSYTAQNVMELLDLFISSTLQDEHMLFVMWGHSWEMERGFPRKCPPEQLEKIFAKIAGRSDITYCTCKEAFEQGARVTP
ncbi:MAG: polysaccharide deacetylase family protein [Lachnospiraceae bacterium]|nr:polysaccharide deacetylase family protein [Lachnospiraceae bacterium]